MAPWLATLFAVLAVSGLPGRAQDLEWEAEPCQGCDDEDGIVKRSLGLVPRSPVAAGMLTRRSALDNNFMRFGRSVQSRAREPRTDNFVRFGRSPVNDEFDRTLRGDPKGNNNGFLRFGRAKDSYMRFGRAKENFVRFGRAQQPPGSSEEDEERENYVRFGRSVGGGGGGAGTAAEQAADTSNTTDEGTVLLLAEKRAAHKAESLMRFGRSKDNYMRFGRAKDNYMRFGRAKDNYMRFGRGNKDNYMRFGRGKDDFMRFGRKDDFMRFGRSDDVEEDYSENRGERSPDNNAHISLHEA